VSITPFFEGVSIAFLYNVLFVELPPAYHTNADRSDFAIWIDYCKDHKWRSKMWFSPRRC